jgi:hypothetical protein
MKIEAKLGPRQHVVGIVAAEDHGNPPKQIKEKGKRKSQ